MAEVASAGGKVLSNGSGVAATDAASSGFDGPEVGSGTGVGFEPQSESCL